MFVHKASFVLWFFAMTAHVLGHLAEVARLAPRDWMRRTRHDVRGAGARQWLIAASLVAGALLGLALLGRVRPWLASTHADASQPSGQDGDVVPGPAHQVLVGRAVLAGYRGWRGGRLACARYQAGPTRG